MIDSCYIEDDVGFAMINIQCDQFYYLVNELFERADKLYSRACCILDVCPDVYREILTGKTFEYLPLQFFYDGIAAEFRRRYADRIVPELPGLLDGRHYERRIREEWRAFYNVFIDSMYDQTPRIIREALAVVVFPKPDSRGIEAEDKLNLFINNNICDVCCEFSLHDTLSNDLPT